MNRVLFIVGVLFAAVALAEPKIVVEAEKMAGNSFGEPVKVSCVGCRRGVTCVKYDAAVKRLYVGGDHALWVLDAAVPESPKLLGVCRGIGAPRQLCVQDGIVYVTARETGVWIIDARDPAKPKVLTRYDTIELATGIDVCHPVLFCSQLTYGIEFIDVTDPAKPERIKVLKTSESQSVVYRNGILYSGEWFKGELTVIDAHDMASAGTVGLEKLKGHGDGVDVDGNFVYCSTGHHYHDTSRSNEENYGRGHGLEIFDISADPLRPKFVSRVQFPRFYSLGNDFWTPVGCGKTVFSADTFNGLFAVDVTDPKAPKTIGRITARNPEKPLKDWDGNLIELTPISDIATADGVVYFAVPVGGLYLSKCALAIPRKQYRAVAPKNAFFRAEYPNTSKRLDAWQPKCRAQVRGVAAYKDVVYAACANAGLFILRRGNDGKLAEAGHFKAPFVGDVRVEDGRLYAAEGFDGVAVYDLKDPAKPVELMRCRDFGVDVNCAIWVWAPAKDLIVVSNRENGYIFLRIASDGKISPIGRSGGCPGWNRYVANRLVGGKWLAQSTANTGFKWHDFSSGKPVETFTKANRCEGRSGVCAFRGDRILRFDREGNLSYLRPGQPENADKSPWKPDAVILDGKRRVCGQPAWDGENLLALTQRNRREVALVDITDEKNPKLLWSETTKGDPDAPCWWKGTLLVPCGYEGLLYHSASAARARR